MLNIILFTKSVCFQVWNIRNKYSFILYLRVIWGEVVLAGSWLIVTTVQLVLGTFWFFYCRFVLFRFWYKRKFSFRFIFENNYLKRRLLFRFQTKTTSLKLVVSFSVLKKRKRNVVFIIVFKNAAQHKVCYIYVTILKWSVGGLYL